MNPNVMRWADEARKAIAKVKVKTGIQLPLNLVLGVIETESSGNPKAISCHGAIGLMQLMPATAEWLGVNPHRVEENIYGGTLYLAKLRKVFPDNLKLVLAAYNAGPGAVKRADNKIPNKEETLRYVPKVLKFMRDYPEE